MGELWPLSRPCHVQHVMTQKVNFPYLSQDGPQQVSERKAMIFLLEAIVVDLLPELLLSLQVQASITSKLYLSLVTGYRIRTSSCADSDIPIEVQWSAGDE